MMTTVDPHGFIEDTVSKADPIEKVDSGMEEDNSVNMMQGDSSDDDDGEIIVKKQVNRSKQRHILDDDSDESDTEITKQKPQTFTAEQALEAVMADSSDSNQDETDITNTTDSAKKRKIKRPVADDSSSDEDNVPNKKNEASFVDEDAKSKKKEDGISQTDEMDEMTLNDDVPSSSRRLDNDSADSDSSDSRSSSGSDDENSDQDNQDKDNADEGFNEDALDPKLLAKIKKGAAKAARVKSARISKNEEKMSIHSESQRIVREGRVNLPYHQPAPKSLNDFLARASKKRQEYQSLRGGVRDTRKAKAIEGVLQSSRLQVKQKTQEELDKYSDSDEDWDANKEAEKSLKERVTDRLKDLDKSVDKEENEPLSKESAENSGIIKCSANDGAKNNHTDDDKNTLPDLIMESESLTCVSKDDTESEVLTCESSSEHDKINKNVSDTKDKPEEEDKNVSDSIDKTEEEDKNVSDTIDKSQEENDSGDLLYEWEKSETCKIDSDIDIKQGNNEIDIASADKENICDNDMLKSSENIPENISSDKNSSPKTKSDKTLKKERLLALAGIDLNINQPRLTGETETFISLVEEEEAPQHPGLVKLMSRLTKHTAKKEKKHSKDLDISIVSKDKVGMNKEELKLNTFTYHIEEEDSNPLLKLETPGAKLLALKEQLQEKIKEKREVARQKRQELYNLDNEEGDFGAEEEEMSEHTDTDVDDDEFEEQYGGDEEEEALDEMENKRERNPFANEQAEEDGEEDEEEGEIDNEEEDYLEDDDGGDADDEDEMNLKLDVSDEEEEPKPEKNRIKKIVKQKEQKCNGDEGDDTSDAAQFKEPSPKKLPEKPFSMFGQRSRDNSFTDTQIQSGQKPTSLRLQIEDSQDLYGTLPQLAPTQEPALTQSSPQQSFNFLLEDSQSVMLDADGYLKSKSTGKKKQSTISAIDELSSTQDDMGDVLGLCSGKFVSQVESKTKLSKKSLFDDSSASNTQNIEDFMGLCSGVFTDSKDSQAQKQGTKRKVSSDDDDDDDNDDDDDSIEALSDNEERNLQNDDQSDEDDEDQGDTDHIEDEEEDQEEKPKKFTGFLQKKGKIRKEFVEEEAELSGSEFDSDENLDIPEEEDIMELEEADKEMAGVDQDELRDEVGRVHLKQLIDEDKREILRLQEMYLADGDLHSEGGGRTRRFKWSNMDDDTQQDMFGDGSDGEGPEHEDAEELQWRKERHEREKFLKEQEKEKEINDGENSQFLKFGKVFLKKQVSLDASKTDKKEEQSVDNLSGNQADTPGFPGSFYKLSKQKRGSFLARSKEALAKIAEMTKPLTNPSAGAKSSGKFTFQVISPSKEVEQKSPPTKKQRKAHVPAQKPNSSFKKPPQKKQKLNTANESQSSVFNHLY